MEKIFDINLLQPQDKIPKDFNLSNYTFLKNDKIINVIDLMNARKRSELWQKKRYPETVKEYKQIFWKYLELCKINKITPIVTLFPTMSMYREFFSKQVLDEFYQIISEAQKKYPFHFLDKFNFDNGLEINDFFDIDHLNNSGARKFSTFVNNYIMELERNSSFK